MTFAKFAVKPKIRVQNNETRITLGRVAFMSTSPYHLPVNQQKKVTFISHLGIMRCNKINHQRFAMDMILFLEAV
jgi:hypothetical protein